MFYDAISEECPEQGLIMKNKTLMIFINLKKEKKMNKKEEALSMTISLLNFKDRIAKVITDYLN